MEGNWNVVYGGKTVGKCSVEMCGLYYLFICHCEKVSNEICRLYLDCGGTRIMLGVLLPDEHGICLKKRLAANSLPMGKPEFYVAAAQPIEGREGEFYPVREDTPFPCISRLESACFTLRDGMPGLVFK